MTVAVTATVGSVAVGAYSTYQSGKAADKAAKNQGKAIDAQSEISLRQMDIAEDQYDYYKENYQPLEGELLENAGVSDSELNQQVAAAGLTTSNSFDSAIQQRERNLQRMGINPNSGAYASSTRKNAISKAVAKANSQNQARASAKQQDSAERAAMVGLGKGMPTAVGGLMSSASSGYGGAVAGYGAQMQAHGQSASNMMNLGLQMGGAALGAGTTEDGSFNWQQFGKNAAGV